MTGQNSFVLVTKNRPSLPIRL
uniref:Uncharacterized protein n=1 Tax=Arundo donax TaxID=35708 RepID=A0A0A9FLG8_ARUDO